MYRTYIKQYLYADFTLSKRPSLALDIFPPGDGENQAICVPGVCSTKPFSALMVDCMPDRHSVAFGQCFPHCRYMGRQSNNLLTEGAGLERIDNISDTALAAFQARYGDPTITKDVIFDYVYGVLHVPDYHVRFTDNFAKSLLHIPSVLDFRIFAQVGRVRPSFISAMRLGWKIPLFPSSKVQRTDSSGSAT